MAAWWSIHVERITGWMAPRDRCVLGRANGLLTPLPASVSSQPMFKSLLLNTEYPTEFLCSSASTIISLH